MTGQPDAAAGETQPPSEAEQLAAELLEVIGAEEDDTCVLSVVYERESTHWHLRHGSLIFGPPGLAQMSWAEWHDTNASPLHAPAGLLGASFAVEEAGLMLGRASLSYGDATALVASLQTGLIPAVGSVPEARVEAVEPPSTPIRVFPHHATEAGRLSLLAARPLRALLFRTDAPANEMPFPTNWDLDGQHLYAPDRWEVGNCRFSPNRIAGASRSSRGPARTASVAKGDARRRRLRSALLRSHRRP